jgi:hypothetical protein
MFGLPSLPKSDNFFDHLIECSARPNLTARPAEWMPWNYRGTLEGIIPR